MSYAQKIIRELDPGVNAVGVEAAMHLQYGTLDHLSREQFAEEIRIARECEAQSPGFLQLCAEGEFGNLDGFHAEARRIRLMDDWGSPAHCHPLARGCVADVPQPGDGTIRMHIRDADGRVWPITDGGWHDVCVCLTGDCVVSMHRFEDDAGDVWFGSEICDLTGDTLTVKGPNRRAESVALSAAVAKAQREGMVA